MAVLGVILGVATCLGTLIGHLAWGMVAAIVTASFLAALYGTAGQTANSNGVQALCLLIVLAGLQLPTNGAIGNGLLILAGSVVQILLLALFRRVWRRDPERLAVAGTFESLAQFVEFLPETPTGPIPPSAAIQSARSVITDAKNLSHSEERDSLECGLRLAETLRASLVGYGRAVGFAVNLGIEASREVSRANIELGGKLLGVGEGLRTRASLPPVSLTPLRPVHIDHEADALHHWGEFERWHGIVQEIFSRLCTEMIPSPAPARADQAARADFTPGTRPRHLLLKLISRITTLPGLPTFDQMALRHAMRYCFTVGLALAATQVRPFPHGYWLPLTVCIVLRSDFNGTINRGLARLLGTGAGVLLASVIAGLFHPSANAEGILSIAATWILFAFFGPSYSLYSFGITLYVVFSVAASTHQEREVGVTRLAATAVGMAMAYAAYYVWPAFHWREMWEVLEEAVRAQIDYARAVLARGEPAADGERFYARSVRIQAEHLYDAASVEPRGISPAELEKARAAILQLDENAAIMLSLSVTPDSEEPMRRAIASSEALLRELDRTQ